MITYRYDAYGNTTKSNNTLNNPYQYNAEYTDSSTGLQYLRARYYDSSQGRFTTKDTYLGNVEYPLSRNLYTYCYNNPLYYTDPSGHFAITTAIIVGAAIGAVVSGGLNVYSQYKQNNGNLNKNNFNWGSFALSTVAGGVAGAVSGYVGAYVATSLAATYGAATLTGVTVTGMQAVGISGISGAAAGITNRFVYTGMTTGSTKQAFVKAFDPGSIIADMAISAGISLAALGIGRIQTSAEFQTAKAKLESFKKFCKDGIAKITGQKVSSPVDISEETLINNYDYELSGKWEKVNEHMSDFSREYQTHVTGRTGESWVQNGVKFDGMKNGVLLDAKGKYSNFIDPNTGEFYNWFSGKDDLLSQANRQIAASEGAAIEWHFAEKDSLNAVKSLFKENGIQGIDLIYDPLK